MKLFKNIIDALKRYKDALENNITKYTGKRGNNLMCEFADVQMCGFFKAINTKEFAHLHIRNISKFAHLRFFP